MYILQKVSDIDPYKRLLFKLELEDQYWHGQREYS